MAGDRSLPATAHVVLGLVSIGPNSGHELSGFAERSIGDFFPVTRSHVYAELDRLCRLGLLDATEVPQDTAPIKRVYEITAAGSEELRSWLERAELTHERPRNLFLVRIFFGQRISTVRLEALLDEYERAARVRRDRLAGIAERLAGRPQAVFSRSTALFGVHREQAKLDWLSEVRPMLLEAAGASPALTCRQGG